MKPSRDSTDLLIPIDGAIKSAADAAMVEDWLSADPKLPAAARHEHARQAQSARRRLADLTQRRDEGETHEVMF